MEYVKKSKSSLHEFQRKTYGKCYLKPGKNQNNKHDK